MTKELTVNTRGPVADDDERSVRLVCTLTDGGSSWNAFTVLEGDDHDPVNDIKDITFLRCASADDWARLSTVKDGSGLKRTDEIDVLVPVQHRAQFISYLEEDLSGSEDEQGRVMAEDTAGTVVHLSVNGIGPYYMPYEEAS